MSELFTPPQTLEEFQAFAVAEAEREVAEWDAITERQALTTPRRRSAGPSTVFSIRLDNEELAALERRAALVGIGPTVLARNYIRMGIVGGGPTSLSAVVGRLADAVGELRALVP